MKKQFLFLMAGGLLAFASCNNAAEGGMSEAQIDSAVNARVEEIRAEMMAQNDSLINAMAQMKADSIIAAMNTGSKGTSKPSASKPVAKPVEEPKKPASGIKGSSDQNRESGVDKIKGSSDQNKESGIKRLKGSSDQNRNK